MSERQLPWFARPDPQRGRYQVVDAADQLVAECFGEDEGRNEAVAICAAINRLGEPVCAECGKPATCFGSYETELTPAYACNECCMHGNEDGHCEPV
jgi:hypothetical protein